LATFQDDSNMTENNIEIYSQPIVPFIIISMGKEDSSLISLEKVIADLDATTNEYFLNVFESKGFDMGILRLRKGETDAQEPHSADEVYFVIEGTGHIEIEDKMKPINRADFIFVPANLHHRFVVGNKDLIVLYFFGSSQY
jgi:mannose-6-phosphate isomerase-like protein (cupin superfamily)